VRVQSKDIAPRDDAGNLSHPAGKPAPRQRAVRHNRQIPFEKPRLRIDTPVAPWPREPDGNVHETQTFEIAIPAATLTSPKEGLDKNMHKVLKVDAHPDITFRLTRLAAVDGTPGALTLLMTDFRIAPPKAMLGMRKTDPKVTVTFETILTVPLT